MSPHVSEVPMQVESVSGSARMVVDLDAVEANYRLLTGPSGTRAAAVVKADAYGTGCIPVAQHLRNRGCDTFFVATAQEALTLKESLPKAHVIVFSGFAPGSERVLHDMELCPVLNTLEAVRRWDAICSRHGSRSAAVHVDTGINRLGVPFADLDDLEAELTKARSIRLILVMSHLACADEPAHPLNRIQLGRFQAVVRRFPGLTASLAGSAGAMLGPEYHFDLIRPGIGIFGGNPRPQLPNPLEPVVEVVAPLLAVRSIHAGDTVGYGATFTSTKAVTIATVGAGYADGFPRTLSGRGVASIAGHPAPYIGRVSMDSIVVDASAVPTHELDSATTAELLGHRVTIDELAQAAGTIPNEILTGLGQRLIRSYRSTDQGFETT